MKPLFRLAVLATAAICAIGATRLNWNTLVVETPEGGHRIGNPEAKVQLIEFVSYTCNHCAQFEVEAQGPMQLAYVTPGKVSIEVRHVLRDPVDLTAAILTNCGPKAKFFLNHSAMLRSQSRWLDKLSTEPEATNLRWRSGTPAERMRAIAGDLDFYEVMETRGYDRLQLDKCLNDTTAARRLAELSEANTDAFAITGTPSFVINGTLLPDTHSWETLRPQIAALLK